MGNILNTPAATFVEAAPRRLVRDEGRVVPRGVLVALAVLEALGLGASSMALVWQGGFSDPDDALRLSEVHAWLGGQSWFDVTAMRLDPPQGASMHWSRLVDLPNALLIRLLGLVAPAATADALDRIILPTGLLVLLFLGMTRLARSLVGGSGEGAAILATVLGGATLSQFDPGRIGHHAPETVTLVFAVAFVLASFERGRTGYAVAAGALAALAFAMSLETLPLFAALGCALAVLWVWTGAALSGPFAGFGAGLGAALPALFLATVPRANWTVPLADALGPGHVLIGLVAAAGAVGLGLATGRLPNRLARAAAAAAFGVLLLIIAAYRAPELLRGPFAGVDPLVREVWLDHVVESKPLAIFARTRPMLALALLMPTLLGVAALVAAATRRRGVAAWRCVALAIVASVGLVLGLCQIRAFASVAPLAACGGLFVVEWIRRRLSARGLATLAAAAPIAVFPVASTPWLLVLPADASGPSTGAACLAPSALAPLATLAPGRAVAPLVLGSHLIATTRLDPFAGPYHRNNDGNRFTLDVWAAAPEDARRLLAARDVSYVVTCPGQSDVADLAARAPDGLAARLAAGRPPSFLVPVALEATPYRVYRVAR